MKVCGPAVMLVVGQSIGWSHTVGPPLNVSELKPHTLGRGPTVWDQPIDWPTTNMTAGLQTFTWNISWGPHFSDTQEFRYWITKPSF